MSKPPSTSGWYAPGSSEVHPSHRRVYGMTSLLGIVWKRQPLRSSRAATAWMSDVANSVAWVFHGRRPCAANSPWRNGSVSAGSIAGSSGAVARACTRVGDTFIDGCTRANR